MPSIFIKKLMIKSIDTIKGPAEKFTIIDENGKYYSAFRNEWNYDWKEGDTLQLEDSQFVSREYNGKTYVDIKPLPRKGSPVAFGMEVAKLQKETNDKLDIILAQNQRVLQLLEQMPVGVNGKLGALIPPK